MNFSELAEEAPEDDESFDQETFDSGVEKRVSVIMLLDTSKSMEVYAKPHIFTSHGLVRGS